MGMKEMAQPCCVGHENCAVMVTDFKKGCKYHNKKGVAFSSNNLTPGGMCPYLFHKVYPYSLALLYGANFGGGKPPDSLILQCPALDNNVSIEIYRIKQNAFRNKTINFLKEILVKLNLHCNPLYYRVFFRVTAVKGVCGYKHKTGDIFEFNIGNSPEICPAAFDALFARTLTAKNESLVTCPDHLGRISFKIIG